MSATTLTAPASKAEAVLGALRRSGRRGVGAVVCPLHDDSRPSLLVAGRSGLLRCAAGCLDGAWVSPQAFLVAMGMSPAEAAEAVSAAGVPGSAASAGHKGGAWARPPGRLPEQLALSRVLGFLDERRAAKAKVLGAVPLPGDVAAWAVARGLVAERLGRWLSPVDDSDRRALMARFPRQTLALSGLWGGPGRGWVVGPEWGLLVVCRDRTGVPVWAQAVGLCERAREVAKYRNPLGVPPEPFGADTVAGAKTVVVAEGMTDSLAVLGTGRVASATGRLVSAAGRVGVIGVPGAASWRPEWFAGLDRRADVVVSFDPDPAGDKAAERLMAVLGRRHPSVRRWRPEGGDLNDILAVRG